MRQSRAYLFIFKLLLLSLLAHGQTVEKKTAPKPEGGVGDSLDTQTITYQYGLFIGAEYGKFIENAFKENRSRQELFVRLRAYRKWHLMGAYGRGEAFLDQATRSGWQIRAVGTYLRLGFDYTVFQSRYSSDDNVYLGLRYGSSHFDQTIERYVIRTYKGYYNQTGSLPKSRVGTDWLGLAVGAQVGLFNTGFYLGVEFNPRFILHETTLNDIKNLYTPGFGEDINGRAFDYRATIAYRIPLFKRRVKVHTKVKAVEKSTAPEDKNGAKPPETQG